MGGVMKIRYLGTSAHEGLPAPFCNCDTCRRARTLGERNFRSRSQALIDGELLIDFNADTFMHFMRYRIPTDRIKACLITHTHSDHFYPDDMAIGRYAIDPGILDFYVGSDGFNEASASFEQYEKFRGRYTLTEISPYEIFDAHGYSILALKANHDPATSPLNFAVAKGGKKMLYAHDTGYFFDESLYALKDFGTLDFISMDCTGGLLDAEWGCHMTFKQVKKQIEILRKENIINDRTTVTLSHFSHIGNATYDDMVEECKGSDLIIAYDGLEIEF